VDAARSAAASGQARSGGPTRPAQASFCLPVPGPAHMGTSRTGSRSVITWTSPRDCPLASGLAPSRLPQGGGIPAEGVADLELVAAHARVVDFQRSVGRPDCWPGVGSAAVPPPVPARVCWLPWDGGRAVIASAHRIGPRRLLPCGRRCRRARCHAQRGPAALRRDRQVCRR
jgi:hypothetical protein